MKKTLLYLTSISLILSTAACATPPKPPALVDLQVMLKDPDTYRVRLVEGANSFVSEARQYEGLAEEAYNDGKVSEAEHLSLLGTLRYKMAHSLYERTLLQKKIHSANTTLNDENAKLQKLSEERNTLLTDVNRLNQELILAHRKAGALIHQSATPSSLPKAGAQQLEIDRTRALRQTLSKLITEANQARGKAAQVNADRFAPKLYSLPLNKLNSIQTSLNNNIVKESMVEDLNGIIKNFNDAYQAALPKFNEEKDRGNIPLRRKQLMEAVSKNLDGASSVVDIPNGVRVILPALYGSRDGALDSTGRIRVDKVARVVKDFDDFQVLVEGFTSKSGKTTESLSLSQMRAQGATRIFEDSGFPRSRIEWRGFGASDFRYEPSSNQNDRVEIVIQRFE